MLMKLHPHLPRITAAAALAAASPALAQDTSVPASNYVQLFEPSSQDGDTDNVSLFGESVGLSGDWALVGDREDDSGGVEGRGAAYFYENVGGSWLFRQKVVGMSAPGQPDLTPGAEFGAGLAIDGDTAVISAFRDNRFLSQLGSAFVYKLDNGVWTQTQNIGPGSDGNGNTGEAGDFFGGDDNGRAVDISGNRIAVGAFRTEDNPNFNDSGALYIYEDNSSGFVQTARLVPDDNDDGDQFGYAVGIDGDYAIAGAFRADEPGSQTGSAYIFQRDAAGNWNQDQKLLPSDVAAGDQFGARVAISGDTAVVTSFRADDIDPTTNSQSGKAYVFELVNDTWVETQTLLPSDLTVGDQFGTSLDIDGDLIVIGAESSDEVGSGNSRSGSAYYFQEIGGVWTEVANFYPDNVSGGDNFAHATATDGVNVIFGTEPGGNGSAYIFSRVIPEPTSAGLLAGLGTLLLRRRAR